MTPAQHFRAPDGAQDAETQVIGTVFLNTGYKRPNTILKTDEQKVVLKVHLYLKYINEEQS